MADPSDKYSPKMSLISGSSSPQEQRVQKRSAARLSILWNAALVLLKLGVGLWSGSVGVLSEALHSATDLMASGIAFFSVRASDTPPDEEHPYGHGKIESLSGLAEAALIFGAAVFIIWDAVGQLRSPASTHAAGVHAGLALMAFSALVNYLLSSHLERVAQSTDSPALKADAQHLRTDVTTSLGVFLGLGLARLTGIAWFDPLTALLIALVVLHTAYRIAHDALSLLVDTRLPYPEVAAIQEILEADSRVLGYHKLRTRKSGSQRHADVHVQIDDNCTLVQAHDLTEELEDQIRAKLPAIQVNIHIEPYYAELRHQQEVHGIVPVVTASGSKATDGSACTLTASSSLRSDPTRSAQEEASSSSRQPEQTECGT